ncbi:MAG: restriction endonuclease subunit S [Suilimivivens sp.]
MRYKLGDIAPIRQGNVADEDEYWLLNLDMVESNTGRIIDYLTVPKEEIGNSTVTFDTKNVLYSKLRPYLNKVVLPQQSGYATSEMLPLRPDKNVITREYLTYFLRSPKFVGYINEKTGGAKMPRANISDLKAVEIDCPDIDVQKKITEAFDRLTDIIAKRQQELIALDDLIKARFVEMFGDPIVNEKRWAVVELNSVCDGIGDGLHGTPEYDEKGKYPFINGNNLMNGAIEITPATKMVDEATYKRHFIELSNNAILLSINGTLGKLAFYNGEEVMLGKSACYCNLKSCINRDFVYGVMKTDAFTGFLESNSTASTIKNVGLKAIRGFMLIMPPEELQTRYVEFAKQVDKSKVAVQKALTETQLLFDSLMQQYFG